jgi:hypothetical protein
LRARQHRRDSQPFLRIQNDLEAEWADPREIEGEEMGRRNPRAQAEEEGKNPRLDDTLGKIPQETSEGKKQQKKHRLDDDPKNTQHRMQKNDKNSELMNLGPHGHTHTNPLPSLIFPPKTCRILDHNS